jgi:hypothetical protein
MTERRVNFDGNERKLNKNKLHLPLCFIKKALYDSYNKKLQKILNDSILP